MNKDKIGAELLQYLDRDYAPVPEITAELRAQNLTRRFTGGVRINQGKYRTAAEDARYRRESLARKLP